MKNPVKMNILYLIAFILMCVCVLLFALAMLSELILGSRLLCVVTAAAGVFLALAAIILALLSKPKENKPPKSDEDESLN